MPCSAWRPSRTACSGSAPGRAASRASTRARTASPRTRRGTATFPTTTSSRCTSIAADRKSVVKGKSVDHCVTGVQTCALPICGITRFDPSSNGFTAYTSRNSNLPDDNIFSMHVDRRGSEERREGKECRSLCDWSSDVCSSDLRHHALRPELERLHRVHVEEQQPSRRQHLLDARRSPRPRVGRLLARRTAAV